MRVGRWLLASLLLAAAVTRCTTFGSGAISPLPNDGAPADAAVGEASAPALPDAESADALPAPPTFYCPTEAGSCIFGRELCCIQHSSQPFRADDVPVGACLEAGTECLGTGTGPVTPVTCDRSELCGGTDAAPRSCCIQGDYAALGCFPGYCAEGDQVCNRSATVSYCADASARCGLLNSAQGNNTYGACE